MRWAAAVLLPSLALLACDTGGGEPPGTADRIGPYPVTRFYLGFRQFRPADNPVTVPASEAGFLLPEDEVFGVVLGETSRAYPVTLLSYHHAVNDIVAGRPIAVFY